MPASKTILLAGASRGLGLGLAAEYLSRGWHVIATARTPDKAPGLSELKAAHPDELTVEQLDVADTTSVTALAGRLQERTVDVLFVVAGINAQSSTPIQDVAPGAVATEFATNAVAPIALAEAFQRTLPPDGMVVFMTSVMGSIGSNASGSMDLYRASKSALNMLASCFALRHKDMPVLLLHPGWVRTEMGGPNAQIDIPTSARGMADVVGAYAGKPGLSYLDYEGTRLPW